MSVEQKINNWAAKTGKSVEELNAEINEIVKELLEKNPGMDLNKARSRAMLVWYARYKSSLRTTAVMVEFIALGLDVKRDVTVNLRKEAEKMKSENWELALQKGYIDEQGNILDFRKTLKFGDKEVENKQYGQKLEPVYMRTVYGVAKKVGEETIKTAVLSLRGDACENPPLVGVKCKVPVYVRKESDDLIELSSARNWKIHETVQLPKETIMEMLSGAPLLKPLEKVADTDDPYSISKVLVIGKTRTKDGKYMVFVEDPDNEDIEAEPITCFMPESAGAFLVDVEEGDIAYLVCKGYWREREEGKQLVLNGFGIFK